MWLLGKAAGGGGVAASAAPGAAATTNGDGADAARRVVALAEIEDRGHEARLQWFLIRYLCCFLYCFEIF